MLTEKECTKCKQIKAVEFFICFHYSNLQPLWATREIAMRYGESADYIGNLEKQNKLLSEE